MRASTSLCAMPRSSSSLLCASWNVNGIRALHRKELLPWDQLPQADVLALQETKAHAGQIPEEIASPAGWHASWHAAQKPGYSGVAMLSREKPDEVIEGMGDPTYDCEGRVLSLRFGKLVITSAYFPNSQDAGKRLDYKLGFCAAMEEFLATQHAAGYETLLMGDYNIAHQPIDLARPKANEQNAGYLPEEREWMTRYLDELGYHDVFREQHPELAGAYTWWSFRGGARGRNIGWRIDYGTVSPALRDKVGATAIHPEIMGSDHCPVSVEVRP